MNEIIFTMTSNVFLNAGIIGLVVYLEKNKNNYNFSYILEEDCLKIKSDNLLELLENIYYDMGKKYYDTSDKKAREKVDKYYFTEIPFTTNPFAKMYTYGLGGLLTNNATPTPSKDCIKIKFNKLYESNYDFAYKIAKFLNSKDKKLKHFSFNDNELSINPIDSKTGKIIENNGGESEIYINSVYTKTPKMEFNINYFKNGDLCCYLTGERFKKLDSLANTSPLLSGLNNFESQGKSRSRQISWKASYLSKFSPVACLYMYTDSLNKIVCYFFSSDNLKNSYKLYKKYSSMFMDTMELIENDYRENFRLIDFNDDKKSVEDKKKNSQFILQHEILFVLLYTFYRKFLFHQSVKNDDVSQFNIFKDFSKIPVYLTYFKSDKFASTMRPDLFEEFNNFKFIMSLFIELEKLGWDKNIFFLFLKSLLVIKLSDEKSMNRYKLERMLRNEILNKILRIKSIVEDIKKLFYFSYNELLSGIYKYKNYKLLIEFLLFYEKNINFGGEEMNEQIQVKAIKFGSSIGISMVNYNNPAGKKEKEVNIRNSKKYIIGLNKANTLEQFLSETKRIQLKFGIVVNEDLLKEVNESNWEYIKNLTIISALNKVNIELLPEKIKEGNRI